MKVIKSRYIYLTLLILATILALWISSRWDVWTTPQPETEFTYVTYPDRITMTTGENFITQRNISWRCDTIPKPSGLLLATPTGDTIQFIAKSNLVESIGGKDIFYKVCLDSLIEDSNYNYTVFTGDSYSGSYSFHTPKRDDIRRIAYISDVQDTIGGNSKHLFHKLHKLYSDYDFIAYGGDLIEYPIDKYWNNLFIAADSTFSTIPVVAATGNHEYHKSIFRILDERWCNTYVYPHNGSSGREGRSYYTTDNDKLLLISIDTNGLVDPISLWNTNRWLDKILRHNSSKWVIVLMHHPIYSVKGTDDWFLRQTLEPLFDKYAVDVVLQNHEHNYMRLESPSGSDRPVYITSNASHKSYEIKPHESAQKVIHNIIIYQDIIMDNTKLTFTAYNTETDSIVDSFTLLNK
ncbi:MAG: metallophosphoesterase [Bacteroidales bacterium]